MEDVAIGRTLRRLRVDAGMTQAILGEKVGVSYQQIQKYEIGTNRIALSTCLHLAEALNIRPRDLIAMVEQELGHEEEQAPAASD